MKQLKLFVVATLCIASLFSFAACSKSESNEPVQETSIEETSIQEPEVSEIETPETDESADGSESIIETEEVEIVDEVNDYPDAPEGMIISDTAFDEWTLEKKMMLYPFMASTEFSFSIPTGQADSKHKSCVFYFKDDDKLRELEGVEFYYAVEKQQILYTGLDTNDESVLESDDFREACVRLMLGYNATFNSDASETTPNISRERAEAIVNFCIDNKIRCIVDDMRIRVVEQPEDDFYSFHIEY